MTCILKPPEMVSFVFFVRRRASTSHRSGPALFCLFWRFLSRRWWKKWEVWSKQSGKLKFSRQKGAVFFQPNQDFGRFWMAPLGQEPSQGQRVDRNQELNCFHFWMWFRFTGCWFGTWFLFSPIVGMMIQSDELHHFSRGRSTTNQV